MGYVVRQGGRVGLGITSNPEPLCAPNGLCDRLGHYSCCGQLYMCENVDGCCQETTWNETTYHIVKGEETWFHWLEDFVRRNIWTYFTAEALGNLVYDLIDLPGWTGPPSLVVPAQLVARCEAAIRNFEDLFQIERWVRNANQIQIECNGNTVNHSGWTATGPVDQARHAAAAKRVLGHVPSPGELAEFAQRASDLIKAVPRYNDGAPRGVVVPPEWGDGSWIAQPPWPLFGQFFWYTSGSVNVVPIGWAKQFIDTFAPGSILSAGISASVSKTLASTRTIQSSSAIKKSIVTKAISKSQKNIGDTGKTQTKWSAPQKAVVAAAGVSLLVIAFVLLG